MVWISLLALWVTIGLALGLAMGRHGHSPVSWGLVGVLLGPLAIPLAFDARAHRHDRTAVVAFPPMAKGGPVSLVVGIDGSTDALAALRSALDVLGERVGRLRLVAVVSQDASSNRLMFDDERAKAQAWLAAAAGVADDVRVEQVVVAGNPVDVLTRLARDDLSVIAVGRRGRGLSKRIFGSVATALAERAEGPVLIGAKAAESAVGAA